MGIKIDNTTLDQVYKFRIRCKILDLEEQRKRFEALYQITKDDTFKRKVWRIEQKIKNLEELL
jgi:hypothetical protein